MTDEEFLETVGLYNQGRKFFDKGFYSACYAPFVSLYLDQFGNAIVCCQNREHVLGNIETDSLHDIWNGKQIQILRESLRTNDLRKGCAFCEKQFLMKNPTGHFMKRFDHFAVPTEAPPFPKLIEFSVSNTCNLECIMCNGDWSSSIRTRREKRSPMKKVYGDRFFEELREFLPHLERAYFYGGEPFLEHEAFRIWDMMVELGLETPCMVTTNGTTLNKKVERVIEKLPFSFSLSLDGITKETFESIRRNAKFDEVIENFKRFHRYCQERGTQVALSHCLMVQNWHEFGDYLLFADEWQAEVWVNTVSWPREVSLYALPTDRLAEVVDKLESQDSQYRSSLGLNRQVWVDELQRLRSSLDHRLRMEEELAAQRAMAEASKAAGESEFEPGEFSLPIVEIPFEVPLGWGGRIAKEPPTHQAMTLGRAREVLSEWAGQESVGQIDVDAQLVIVEANVDRLSGLAFRNDEFVGVPLPEVKEIFKKHLGSAMRQFKSEQHEEFIDDIAVFTNDRGEVSVVRALSVPRFDAHGSYQGMNLQLACQQNVSDPGVWEGEASPTGERSTP
jgi:MoaA/NifB/PqqE/SkfB family radical SAM enzyme